MSANPNRLLTSHEAGALLQMDPSSIVKWVNDGLLPAFRTPGKHRRIKASDLLAFLRTHGMYIPAELAEGAVQVLVVDDDEHFLKALGRAMKNYKDFEFSACTSGIEALVHVGARKPDVLVIDVHMPEVDGLDVLRVLKANPSTRDVQVVMMTGKPSADLEKRAIALGAKALVEKPLTAARLVDALAARAA